jgi:hypothetical protein
MVRGVVGGGDGMGKGRVGGPLGWSGEQTSIEGGCGRGCLQPSLLLDQLGYEPEAVGLMQPAGATGGASGRRRRSLHEKRDAREHGEHGWQGAGAPH